MNRILLSNLLSTISEKKMTVYCDMDGVLARFENERNAIKRYDNEIGFFKYLQPFKRNVSALKQIINNGANVKILTTSPNEQADNDKIEWLKFHLPEIPNSDIIIVRQGKEKTEYVEDFGNALLIDDYTHNLKMWIESGGLVAKLLNRYDSPLGQHTVLKIPYIKSIWELL